MIKKFIRSYLILNLLLLASAAAAQTPSGVIRGTVLDAKSKQPVIGASVSVDGTAMGTATDLEGKFLLTGVPTGPCSVRISFLSYKPFTSGPLTIKGGESTELNVELVEEVSELENVVVVATRKVNSDAGLLSQMREMSLVASGTSAQAIAKTQDRDASAAFRVFRFSTTSSSWYGASRNATTTSGSTAEPFRVPKPTPVRFRSTSCPAASSTT